MACQCITVLMFYPGTWPVYRSNATIYLYFNQTKRTVGSRTGGMSWIVRVLPVCLQSENQAIAFLLPTAFFNPTAVQRGHLFKSRMLLALLSQHMEQTRLVSSPLHSLKRQKQAKIKPHRSWPLPQDPHSLIPHCWQQSQCLCWGQQQASATPVRSSPSAYIILLKRGNPSTSATEWPSSALTVSTAFWKKKKSIWAK